MIRGAAKFDGLALLEGSFSFLGSGVKLDGKAAFVNSKTGDTHGWTSNHQWSPQVIEKLRELRALMEMDLGRLHLDGGGEVLATTAPIHTNSVEGALSGGLGEHLEGDQV